MAKKAKKGSWLVRIKVTAMKTVVCDDCTEDEARENPFDHAVEESEEEQIDWDVRSVEPNE